MTTLKFVGNTVAPLTYQELGIQSLDQAFMGINGQRGIPVGKMWEIYGNHSAGKSLFAYSIAARLSQKGIALLDLEDFNPEYVGSVLERQGFDKYVYSVSEDTDEQNLQKLVELLNTDEYDVGIVDALGSLSPIGEAEGDIGEANMGRRAKMLAQFCRRAINVCKRHGGQGKPKTILLVNHTYSSLGYGGMYTPGGKVKDYLCSVRLKLKRDKTEYDLGFMVDGTITKNKWGFKGNNFKVFLRYGHGIDTVSDQLLAMIDDGRLKLKSGRVYRGKEHLGFLKKIMNDYKLMQEVVNG